MVALLRTFEHGEHPNEAADREQDVSCERFGSKGSATLRRRTPQRAGCFNLVGAMTPLVQAASKRFPSMPSRLRRRSARRPHECTGVQGRRRHASPSPDNALLLWSRCAADAAQLRLVMAEEVSDASKLSATRAQEHWQEPPGLDAGDLDVEVEPEVPASPRPRCDRLDEEASSQEEDAKGGPAAEGEEEPRRDDGPPDALAACQRSAGADADDLPSLPEPPRAASPPFLAGQQQPVKLPEPPRLVVMQPLEFCSPVSRTRPVSKTSSFLAEQGRNRCSTSSTAPGEAEVFDLSPRSSVASSLACSQLSNRTFASADWQLDLFHSKRQAAAVTEASEARSEVDNDVREGAVRRRLVDLQEQVDFWKDRAENLERMLDEACLTDRAESTEADDCTVDPPASPSLMSLSSASTSSSLSLLSNGAVSVFSLS